MLAHKRLQRELVALQKEPPKYIRAKPLESDILIFHYVIEGPPDSPYAGGLYHGVLKFPPEYPLKPPAIMMYTPSGRFEPAKRLCLSMSDFHPESWNPTWSVATILIGLQSFMLESAATVGSVETSDAAKRAMAAESLSWNCDTSPNRATFRKLFPELVELREERARAAAVGAAAAPGGAAASAGGSGSSASSAGGAKPAAPAAAAPAAGTAAAPAAAASPAGWVAMAVALCAVLVAIYLATRGS